MQMPRETSYRYRHQSSFSTTGNHHVRITILDKTHGVTYGMSSSRTCSCHRMIWALTIDLKCSDIIQLT